MFAKVRLYFGEFKSADEILQTLYIVRSIELPNEPQLCRAPQQNDGVNDMY